MPESSVSIPAKKQCVATDCRNDLPRGKVKYCSDGCRQRQNSRNYRTRQRTKNIVADAVGHSEAVYKNLELHQLFEPLLDGRISQQDAGSLVGANQRAVSRALAKYTENKERGLLDGPDGWLPAPEVLRMLMLDDTGYMLAPAVTEGPEFERWLSEAVIQFVRFRDTFFVESVGPDGKPQLWLTEPFHRKWIREILRAIYTGAKQLILSPPRHGKSELLVAFCVWLICRNPNIRILWVGGSSGSIPQDMLGAVRKQLDGNDKLVAAVLPPGHIFDPGPRSGLKYSNTQFTVSTRNVVSPSPTMVAVGRNGEILSRTCDVIVCDDLESKKSTDEPGMRESTRKWFTSQLDSRHEDHTAWITIGSRQHPDDIYNYLINDPEWHAIVESAHEMGCVIDPNAEDRHVDCMLFPRVRTYKWLMRKRRAAASVNEEGLYEMTYLNTPRPEGTMLFVKEEIEQTYNRHRGLGVPVRLNDGSDPSTLRKIGGLDPSSVGYQSAVGWGWQAKNDMHYLIDIDNHRGGGVYEALELFKEWLILYDIRHWVIEENGFQKAIREDRIVRHWASENDVVLEGHETYANKHDRLYGVGAMSRLYRELKVDLPFGDQRSQEKTLMFTRQMLNFSEETGRSRSKSDILMASWFPTRVIRRWRKERQAKMSVHYDPSYAGFASDMYSQFNEAPWR